MNRISNPDYDGNTTLPEDWLEHVVSVSGVGHYVWDVQEDRCIYCSERHAEIHGHDVESYIAQSSTMNGMAHPDDQEDVRRAFLGLRRGEPLEIEFRIIIPDGTTRVIRETGVPVFDKDGNVVQEIGTSQDISESRRLKAELSEAEAMLQTGVEALPVGFAIFSADGRLGLCNSMYRELLPRSAHLIQPGLSYEDLVRNSADTVAIASGYNDVQEYLDDLFTEPFDQKEWTYKQSTGRWVKRSRHPTRDGGFISIVQDITLLKQNELELEEKNHSLTAALDARQKAEARFADLTGFSTEWYWEQDRQHRFTFFSDGFERATGIDPTTLLGRRRDEFGALDPEAGAESGAAAIVMAIEAHQPFRDLIYNAVDVRNDEMWVRTSGKPVFSKHGDFLGYRGVAADVTDLYRAVREAKAADEAKTQFLSLVSHELRTPLTVMLGYNSFILNNGSIPSISKLKQAVEHRGDTDMTEALEAALAEIQLFSTKIQSSGKDLLAIMSDLLDSTSMDSGEFGLELARVDPQNSLEPIIQRHQRLAEKKGLGFSSEIASMPVLADPKRLQQVLSNLLGNALKFTEVGSITVKGWAEDDVYRFEVRDTGIGIQNEILQKVFEPFFQADETQRRSHDGIGLGLSIARKLIRLHNGEIFVDSAPGTGTCVRFTLPLFDKKPIAQGRV